MIHYSSSATHTPTTGHCLLHLPHTLPLPALSLASTMASSSEKKTLTLINSMCLILVCLLPQSLVAPVLSRSLEGGAGFAERKDYYSPPDPHGNDHGNGHGGGHGGTPHGSHGTGGSPPCENPPSTGGGGGGVLPPTSPSTGGGGGVLPPTTPSTGGGVLPPTTPSTGGGGGHGNYNPPTSPVIINPPGTVQPAPMIPTPMLPDPNSPFSCDYWRTHPTAILTLLGYWCPLSQIFGLPNPNVVGGSNASLLDALSNTRRDGISALYREGTAAYLNSLATRDFYFSSQQVRDAFVAAAASGDDGAAAAQADVFKRANEGLLQHH